MAGITCLLLAVTEWKTGHTQHSTLWEIVAGSAFVLYLQGGTLCFVAVLSLCLPPAALFHSPHLCATQANNHTYLIKPPPLTCFQSDWLDIKAPAHHALAAGLFITVWCARLSGGPPAMVLCPQLCLNSNNFFSLLSAAASSAFAVLVLVCRFLVVWRSRFVTTVWVFLIEPVTPCWTETPIFMFF